MTRRLLFLDHSAVIGGAELALADHVRHLDRAAFTPFVACSGASPALIELYRESGAVVETLAWPRLRGMRPSAAARIPATVRQLRRLVERHGIDLVVTNTSRSAYTATVTPFFHARGGRVPLLWWVRDFDFGRGWFRLLRWRPDRIVCVSNAIRAHYAGADDARYQVVYVGSGLHAKLDAVSAADLEALRERWRIAPDDLVVGYMGRLVEDKGPEDLVRAVAMLGAEFPRLRLVIVGTGAGQHGDVERRLHEQVAAAGLDPVVRFTGHQFEQALYHRLFDIFVLTSRYREALSTSVIEAMMAGTPVIATRTGGTPELVVDGETGILVPPRSPETIAGALQRLLRDRGLAQRLTQAAHARVMTHHREAVVSRQMEAIYDALLLNRDATRASRSA